MGNTVSVRRTVVVYLVINFQKEHINVDVWRMLKNRFFNNNQMYTDLTFNLEKANIIAFASLLSPEQSRQVKKLALNVSGAKGDELTKCPFVQKLETVQTIVFDFNSIPMDSKDKDTVEFVIQALQEASNTTVLHLAMQNTLVETSVFSEIISQISKATSIRGLHLDIRGNNLVQEKVLPDEQPLIMIAAHLAPCENFTNISIKLEENCANYGSLDHFLDAMKKFENLEVVFENTLMANENVSDDQFQHLCDDHKCIYQKNSDLKTKTISRKSPKTETTFLPATEVPKNVLGSTSTSSEPILSKRAFYIVPFRQGKTITVLDLIKLEGYADRISERQFDEGIFNQSPYEIDDYGNPIIYSPRA